MMILLQTVPPHIDLQNLEKKLISVAKDEYQVSVNSVHPRNLITVLHRLKPLLDSDKYSSPARLDLVR